MSATTSLRHTSGAMVILLLGSSAPLILPPERASARPAGHSRHENPFPSRIDIDFTLETRGEDARTDHVTFTATRSEYCTPGEVCHYDGPHDPTVVLDYNDSFGCHGTASAPPFTNTMATVGIDYPKADGTHPLTFSVRLDYNTVRYWCDNGTSGVESANSTAGSTPDPVSWRPGQQESRGVPVDNFLGARGHADIRYRY
ncbi:hypothetical protein, partial [Actinoplanes xinjiangensis]|uniref:Uncharacterized protein n=1 Tax=Actinoplanes xinjiangensis TaxID=512350 RepID=A0A316ED15_9ACTN